MGPFGTKRDELRLKKEGYQWRRSADTAPISVFLHLLHLDPPLRRLSPLAAPFGLEELAAAFGERADFDVGLFKAPCRAFCFLHASFEVDLPRVEVP